MNILRSNKAVRIGSLLVLIILILAITSPGKEDATIVGGSVSPEKKVAYLCRPGVAMITSQYTGNLISIDDDKPVIYIYTKPYIEITLPELSLGGMGTGFIVSSDGYIVTNAHVVHTSDEEIRNAFASQAVQYVADQWPKLAESQGVEADTAPVNPTEEDLEGILDVLRSENQYKLQYKQEIKVYYGMPSGSASSPEGHPAEIRKISPESLWLTYGNEVYRSGKDLAIIKIEGSSNLPTLLLGDSNGVEVGDKVITIGYPGTVISASNPHLSPETNLVPTVTSGIVSAIRKLPDGSEIIQSDATIFHGNSGGPAFDESGKVIGVTTFGSGKASVSGEWLDIQGYNFLIPVNVAKSFIKELNINTTPSEATVHFEKGLEYYWNNTYSDAEREFNRILNQDPNNKYASDYMRMSMSHQR